MALETDAAYALAAWSRFDNTITDNLLRAVASTFALVAVADGDFADAEVDRFRQLLREQADKFAQLNMDRIEPLFRDVGGALLSDPVAGRRHALELISAVAREPDHRKLVRAAAAIAIHADGRVLDDERDMLAEIDLALANA
jgi:tellurite resistance protein